MQKQDNSGEAGGEERECSRKRYIGRDGCGIARIDEQVDSIAACTGDVTIGA